MTHPDQDPGPGSGEPGRPPDHAVEEPVRYLERGQLVAETSRPVPRAELSPRTVAGLWALRVFGILVSLMVIGTFVYQLR
jgi:hypothetical protein